MGGTALARLFPALSMVLLTRLSLASELDCESCKAVQGDALLQVRPGDLSIVNAQELEIGAEETKGDDSFEAARPGSCCQVDPHTHVAWSEYAADDEVAQNMSAGLPVVVPCGLEVTMDEDVSELHGLQVFGSVRFKDGVDILLETSFIFVCGRFSIGSSTTPHLAKVEIVLTGSTELLWPTPHGVKNFGKAPFVTYGGSLYLRGSACGAASWTRLSASIGPAANEVKNLARGQNAVQSSIGHHRYVAAKAVDGSSSWKWGSMLTAKEQNPWWYVRVDASLNGFGRVTLTKRSKWGSDLSRATVGVASAPCQKGSLCGGTLCRYVKTQGGKSDFDCGGASGSFVYVQMKGLNQLSMAEAEVFAHAGDSTIELKFQDAAHLAWRAGDRLVIAATGTKAEETEEVTVVDARPGHATVTGKLLKWHQGCDATSEQCVIAAEVASLSRNIVIKGRSGCDPVCGHFMIAHTNHGFVCGAEFTNLGQTAVEGRYPFHIHLPGEAPNLIVKRNALHHNINRGLVMHGVHEMRVESNFCYKTKGHCFMLEDGVEQHNHIIRNLGILVYPVNFGCSHSHDMEFKCAGRSDTSPNAFWIPNPNNYFDGNVGVATGGAFFFETRHVMGLVRRKFHSEAMKAGRRGKLKGSTPLAQFSNNMAHSSGMGLGNYPRIGFTAGGRNAYENFTAWRCGSGMSAHTGGSGVVIKGARLVENVAAVRAGHPSNKIEIHQSTMIARPGYYFWNKRTKYTSAPLIMNKYGKTRASQLSNIFTIDAYTRSWVRCNGGYDSKTLAYRGWRGNWFQQFTDPAYVQPCD